MKPSTSEVKIPTVSVISGHRDAATVAPSFATSGLRCTWSLARRRRDEAQCQTVVQQQSQSRAAVRQRASLKSVLDEKVLSGAGYAIQFKGKSKMTKLRSQRSFVGNEPLEL